MHLFDGVLLQSGLRDTVLKTQKFRLEYLKASNCSIALLRCFVGLLEKLHPVLVVETRPRSL